MLRIGDSGRKAALVELPQRQKIGGPEIADCEFHFTIVGLLEKWFRKSMMDQALTAALEFLQKTTIKALLVYTLSRTIRI